MAFSIIIPSKNPDNLISCVRSILANEPDLPPSKIIVVDDGARERAEAELPGLTWIQGVKPFVYARNVNLGIAAAGTDDVIILGDDTRLLTPDGFSWLEGQAIAGLLVERVGILAASVTGCVGNLRQVHQSGEKYPPIRHEPETLCFIAVYICREALRRIGPLDEDFIGYGWEDTAACEVAKQCGLKLGIWDGCLVEHGVLPSTFRSEHYPGEGFMQNKQIFQQKWGGA